jgi:hypothetical protein
MVTHMKTTIEIAPAILERGKQLAREEHVTLRALVEEGLRNVIAVRERKSAFRLGRIHFTGGGFCEGFEVPSWERMREAIYEGRGA